MAKPALGSFYIQSIDEGTIFRSELGDGPAVVTEGYAGWKVTDRPREIGITEWAGRNPMAIEIPFELNFLMEPIASLPGEDCELQVTNLETLCGIGGHTRPPVCRVDGAGLIPHDETNAGRGVHQWVIEQLSWTRESEVRSSGSGRRLKCGGNIVIRQYIDASDILQRVSATARAVKYKTYRVKSGDSLSSIAAKKEIYGDARKWKIIADANNLRDRRNIHVNQLLKIPPL